MSIHQARTVLSETALSNLYTMAVCEPYSPNQKIGDTYSIPSLEIRYLRANLILEEALETIHALGFILTDHGVVCEPKLAPDPLVEPLNLEEIIDGCCDLHYVTVGALMSCGVPDLPHANIVAVCNNAKFPDGKAIIRESDGKYLKPEGWKAPQHLANTFYGRLLERTSKELLLSGGHY